MTGITSLDTVELTTWLTRATQTIDRSLRDPGRAAAIGDLRTGLDGNRAGLHVLAQLALLDDCLRVAHQALEADGVIEPDELARISDLVRVAASKYCFALPPYEPFAEGLATGADIARFLRVHRNDAGAFGYANGVPWRGLALVRTVEEQTRNAAPLREHERMLARIMDEVFGGRATDVERRARRKLRDLFEPAPNGGDDPRAVAFCRGDGPEVFSSVAFGSQIHERDPFDVESIHAEAREVFHRQVERATIPARLEGHGRTLLVLGESGAGKTHLLRALRVQVHANRMGYVGYLQMSSEVGDYARYVLRSLVDSMEKPYDAPGLSESALTYLSDGVVETRVALPPAELELLRTAELSPDELGTVIGKIVDRIVRTEGLETLETDLLHALLLLQRRDPAIQRRVVRFLRCEPLTAYDRQVLAGLAPREHPEDPLRTIRQLATIMYELQSAALVLAVDQLEDSIAPSDGPSVARIQQAFDVLRAIADGAPTAVVVIACIQNVYDLVKPKLSQALIDRLERDPAPVRLTSQREISEIEQMLARRLEHLFATFDVAWREDDPFYPFSAAQIEAVARLRARDCLARFREFHEACVASGSLRIADRPEPVGKKPEPAGADLARAFNDAISGASVPDGDDTLLALVDEALRGAAQEMGLELTVTSSDGRVMLGGKSISPRVAAFCNGRPQGGHLGRQLDALKEAAKDAAPVALRSSDWHGFGSKTAIAQRIGVFNQAGGRTVYVEEHDLRTILAARAMASVAGFSGWRRENQPIAKLAFVRETLGLDRVEVAPPPVATAAKPARPAPPKADVTGEKPPVRPSGQIEAFDPTSVPVGHLATIKRDPISLPTEQIKKHVAFLGSPGSGKTTIALNVVEQLLERGISVLLVDRKGDLARYASELWWSEPSSKSPERKANLRKRVQVSLFTPGNPQGRPLRLPLIPSFRDAGAQERDELARYAASGLTAMMGLPRGVQTTHKESVLKCAIELLADEPEISLEHLRITISQPDPQLLTAVGALQKHFSTLAECVQSLAIQRGALLAGEGEALDVEQLLPPPGDRPRLTIINTAALSEVSVLQFWISRLLVDLGRLAKKRPSATLQAAVFLDEADAYIPASGEPATKGPMFNLLKRARAAGLGVMLATQNPGDFDYKARDNIGTWLVGKVSQDRAIDKMRNLLANYPNVGPRLASQAPGAFFVLSDGPPKEIRAEMSLMSTEQLSDHEIVELARAQRLRS